MSWIDLIADIFVYGILFYSISLISFYIFIGIYSIGEVKNYLRKNSFADYRVLAASTQAPSMSILAPAYNEGATVIENVRSLLSIHYNNLEVIIINDGSKDDSLQKLIAAYNLERIDFFVNEQIPTKKVRGVYKSKNPILRKLIVVDKENGGKADALNVGINISSNDYIVCIDVDCVLEQDALLKLAKPFLETTKKRVIATGGVVRIANGCEIEGGRLVKVKLAKEFLPRVQTLEYIRAFLLGRMAWSRMNGLLLISGAFGAFDKEIAIKCGGYNHKTVGEDMELVVRMRRYMEEQNIKYSVSFIPDPLCWTEAPASFKILGRQRNRWTRGTIETLSFHKKMFFNPRYGFLGMVSYPYWFFYEFLAPIVEFVGFAGFIFLALLGMVDWLTFFYLFGFILSFGFLYSAFAILMEVITYNQYKAPKDILRLLKTALLEPILFHPFVVWSAIKGNIDLLQKKNSWGEMTRQGFATKPATQPASTPVIKVVEDITPVASLSEKKITEPSSKNIYSKIGAATRSFASLSLVWLAFSILFTAYEIGYTSIHQEIPEEIFQILGSSLLNSISFWLKCNVLAYLPYITLYQINRRTARIFLSTLIIISGLAQLVLIQYFSASLLPLGADLFGYSINDIKQTLGASGSINATSTAFVVLTIILLTFLTILLPSKIKVNKYLAYLLPMFSLAMSLTGTSFIKAADFKSDFANNLVLNKPDFFFTESYKHFFPSADRSDIYSAKYIGENLTDTSLKSVAFNYVDTKNYPFLRKDETPDVLSPFFNRTDSAPNIVFVLVEGLGRAFTNRDAYLGNFTPFLDSLSQKSLYWKNFLSSGGRTFAVLPSVLGSLPFNNNGFLELGRDMPPHLTVLNILRANGYESSFYYGGEAKFDNMNLFLKANYTNIYDSKTFTSAYKKMPATNGFTWGYGDSELFKHYLASQKPSNTPRCNVLLTVSMHNPFAINEEAEYVQVFENRLRLLGFDENKIEAYRKHTPKYASILYTDEALKSFFGEYSKRSDYKNTIFIITGDHRMPELPMSTKIDRFHVPLIIYSPLLKRTAQFKSVSSHFDIAPSLLAFLEKNYRIQKPSLAAWIGEGLDTARTFRNIHRYPLMQTKTDMIDFVQGEYHLNSETLYKLSATLDEEIVEDETKFLQLKAAFELFKDKNDAFKAGARLIPDSLAKKYYKQ